MTHDEEQGDRDTQYYLDALTDAVLAYDYRSMAEADGTPTEGVQRWQAALENAEQLHGLLASALAAIGDQNAPPPPLR